MRYTDMTNEELEAFVDMSKMLCDGKITASRFIQFFTELEKSVHFRMNANGNSLLLDLCI